MTTQILRTTECAAPAQVAFDYVADYRNVATWLGGLAELRPVGGRDEGLGAVFDATLRVGVVLTSRIEVDDFEPGRSMGFASVRGFPVRSRWVFDDLPGGRTRVTAGMSYRLPFGPAGRALGRVVGPVVEQALGSASRQLTERVERQAALAA